MAYQDGEASALGSLSSTSLAVAASLVNAELGIVNGTLDANIEAYKIHDAALDIVDGILTSSGDGEEILYRLTELKGTLTAEANASQFFNTGPVEMLGSLTVETATVMYIDAYVAMYGFLSADMGSVALKTFCPDIYVNMEIQTIESSGCTIGDSVDIQRYRGDTYPLRATLGRNGDFSTSGITFTMSTKIDNQQVHSVTGTIIDAETGIVEFAFSADAVAIAGEGVYDIQGDDGYIYTYDKGKFELLADVTI